MGALFSFAAIWVAVIVIYGIAELFRLIAEKLPDSGTFAMILLGIAGFIDWLTNAVRNFFAALFSNTKNFLYWCYTERRKHNEH